MSNRVRRLNEADVEIWGVEGCGMDRVRTRFANEVQNRQITIISFSIEGLGRPWNTSSLGLFSNFLFKE